MRKLLSSVIFVALLFTSNVNLTAKNHDTKVETRLTVQVVDEANGRSLQALIFIYSDNAYTEYVADVYTLRNGRASVTIPSSLATVYLQVSAVNYCITQQAVMLDSVRVNAIVPMRSCSD